MLRHCVALTAHLLVTASDARTLDWIGCAPPHSIRTRLAQAAAASRAGRAPRARARAAGERAGRRPKPARAEQRGA